MFRERPIRVHCGYSDVGSVCCVRMRLHCLCHLGTVFRVDCQCLKPSSVLCLSRIVRNVELTVRVDPTDNSGSGHSEGRERSRQKAVGSAGRG